MRGEWKNVHHLQCLLLINDDNIPNRLSALLYFTITFLRTAGKIMLLIHCYFLFFDIIYSVACAGLLKKIINI